MGPGHALPLFAARAPASNPAACPVCLANVQAFPRSSCDELEVSLPVSGQRDPPVPLRPAPTRPLTKATLCRGLPSALVSQHRGAQCCQMDPSASLRARTHSRGLFLSGSQSLQPGLCTVYGVCIFRKEESICCLIAAKSKIRWRGGMSHECGHASQSSSLPGGIRALFLKALNFL